MNRAETTVFLYQIDEQADEVLPSDQVGNGPDLQPVDPDAVPPVVDGMLGPARQLGDGEAFVSADNVGAADIRRDLTVQAILDFDPAAQSLVSEIGVVVGGGTAWQLHLSAELPSTDRHTVVRLCWEDKNFPLSLDNPEFVELGVVVRWPVGWVLLTATRRWISATEVRVRYYLQDQLIGENTSSYGAIEPSFAPYMTMGCKQISGPDYVSFLAAKIDSWKVTDFEMTAEEIQATYRRITVHQPDGYAMVRACQPVGQVWSDDPDSRIQRELMVEGDAIGFALAKLEELRTDHSPARAWSMLDDWERICRLPPKLLDTVETRRSRVLSFLRKVHGHNLPGVREALHAAFDLAVDDVDVLEYTNLWEDAFAGAVASWWREEKESGDITVVSGEVKLELDNAVDGRWPLTLGEPTILLHSIDGDVFDDDPAVDADVTIELTSASIGNGCHVGLVAWNLARELFFFGYYRTAGVTKVGWRKWSDGSFGAFTSLENPAPALSQWLRMRFDGGTAWTVWWNGVGPDELDNETAIPTGIALPLNVGLALFQDTSSNPSAAECTFDNYRGFFPNGLRVFNWYAYRDPLLDGSPDMPGARAIVQKLKPAETQASAVTVTALKCDSADSLCDDGPLG